MVKANSPASHKVVIWGNAFADRLQELAQRLGAGFALHHVAPDMPDDQTRDTLADALAVIAVSTRAGLPLPDGLRLLQVPGIGWDGVDPTHVPAGAQIANVGGHQAAVAEFCLARMLEWCHRLQPAEELMRQGSWARSSRFGAAPHRELAGQTVTILGYGAIGAYLARLLRAFGVNVIIVNRSLDRARQDGLTALPLEQLNQALADSDFAVLTIALTPDTQGMIDLPQLQALGAEGVLVNIARGPVIDEDALWTALTQGQLGGAILDVWHHYPDHVQGGVGKGHDFLSLPNVMATPHVSGWTSGTVDRRTDFIIDNIRRAAAGQPLLNIVSEGQRG